METSLAESRPPQIDPLVLIQTALEKGFTHQDMKGFFDLQERYEKKLAADAYGEAMAKFAAICPMIQKKRTNTHLGSVFASYDDIMREVQPVLAKCNISLGFDTETIIPPGDVPGAGYITVTCRVRVGSHFEDKKFTCPVPGNVKVNDSQKMGIALSYAKRYCLCAALNIVVTDEDLDAASLNEVAPESTIQIIRNMIADCESIGVEVNIPAFLGYLVADKIENITVAQSTKAIAALNQKRAAGERANKKKEES